MGSYHWNRTVQVIVEHRTTLIFDISFLETMGRFAITLI